MPSILAINALTTLGTAREELGVCSDGSQDLRIERYINSASAMFERYTGRKLYRATDHVERTKGYGHDRIRLAEHVPILRLKQLQYDRGTSQETITSTLYGIENGPWEFPEYVRLTQGEFRNTRLLEYGITGRYAAATARYDYIATYDGGYITPHQDEDALIVVSTAANTTVGFDLNENGASADTIVRNDGLSWIDEGYAAGKKVTVSGAADPADDGTYDIDALTASTLTLPVGSFTTGGLADTAVSFGGTGSRTLPYDIENAILDYVSMTASQQGMDMSIRRLEMDDGVIEWNRVRVPQSFADAVTYYQNVELS